MEKQSETNLVLSDEALTIPNDESGANKRNEKQSQALRALQIIRGVAVPQWRRRRSCPSHHAAALQTLTLRFSAAAWKCQRNCFFLRSGDRFRRNRDGGERDQNGED